jgi:hypothetical protein
LQPSAGVDAAARRERRSPEYFSQFVKSEIERWKGPIKASGVTLD